MPATTSYAELPISQEAFSEIWDKLHPSYRHLLHEDTQTIILGEIALVVEESNQGGDVAVSGSGKDAQSSDVQPGAATSDILAKRLWAEVYVKSLYRNRVNPRMAANEALQAFKSNFPLTTVNPQSTHTNEQTPN